MHKMLEDAVTGFGPRCHRLGALIQADIRPPSQSPSCATATLSYPKRKTHMHTQATCHPTRPPTRRSNGTCQSSFSRLVSTDNRNALNQALIGMACSLPKPARRHASSRATSAQLSLTYTSCRPALRQWVSAVTSSASSAASASGVPGLRAGA